MEIAQTGSATAPTPRNVALNETPARGRSTRSGPAGGEQMTPL